MTARLVDERGLSRSVAVHRIVEESTDAFAAAVSTAARTSSDERAFQIQMATLLESFAQSADVELRHNDQYTLATGRADAVYNRFVIEYERPGSLRSNPTHQHTSHAIKQARDYLEGVTEREGHAKDRLLGAAFDGSYLYFVRQIDGEWRTDAPLSWGREAAGRLLHAVFSLASGRALLARHLVEDFGANNIYSQRVARALYQSLAGQRSPLVDALFRQWQVFFSEVSGYDEAKAKFAQKSELRSFARGMGLRPDSVNPPLLFFAIHTYFSFLAKAIARLVLERFVGTDRSAATFTSLADASLSDLRTQLTGLEEGALFHELGIANLLEGDFFSWYLHAWSDDVAAALQLTLRRLADYDPTTIQDQPAAGRDLLKQLYHKLMPKELRHDLGEYYTPDWLASRLLTQLGNDAFVPPTGSGRAADLKRTLLDPACGSGTFLILAIRALKDHASRAGLSRTEILELITTSIVGIDLNPLAVLASRVGYLLAIADLLSSRRKPVVVPVYLADSICEPEVGSTLFEHGRLLLQTVVGKFPIPASIDSSERVTALADLLHEHVHADAKPDLFIDHAGRLLGTLSAEEARTIRELYTTLLELHQSGRDGVWARVIKNAFMPLFLGRFDYIVGNPPWVLWDNLPDGYRQQTADLWRATGLFVHKGMDAILGKSKKDLSTLMTYVVMKRFLKPQGRLAFVMPQSVFKSSGAAQGYRQLRLADGTPIQVMHVDDMSELQAFEGASTRASIVVLQLGRPTKYPVGYTYWRKTTFGRSLGYESTLAEVIAMTERLRLSAIPVSKTDPTSAWLTARPSALRALTSVLGASDYAAHLGANSGGANAVYWVEVLARKNRTVTARNVVEGAKRSVDQVVTELEADVVLPLLLPRDVSRWHAEPSRYVLMVQDPVTRQGIGEKEMAARYPLTLAYLKRFEGMLRERAAYKRYFVRADGTPKAPFYSMFDVGPYTFMQYKVLWRRIASDIAAAVVGAGVIPDNTISLIGLEDEAEAHYVAAIMNSTPFRLAALAYSQAGGKSFGSPHLLANIRVPRFDPRDRHHRQMSAFGRRAAVDPSNAELTSLDELAVGIWGLEVSAAGVIRGAFEELRRHSLQELKESDIEIVDA